ncbi:hypothetical protein Pint_05655 [Pistacia integerrima]|uniref:Uncharacterized protein n=1 Tax=Pistacia integerrima TaxID=434235 RepID=A0ACC0Z9T2_9ROSI|nr:hypothetical protein Pint_05655 [Pistacia integerrima]
MYKTHPTVSGEVIEVYQPSQEEHQMTYSNLHNIKTWAEMNLLSMCDVLVTSSWSTFGSGPWSMITISHDNCNAKTKGNPGFLLPHLQHCEDTPSGVKLFYSQ